MIKQFASKSERRRHRQTWMWGSLLALALVLLFGTGHRGYGLFDVDEAIFTRATVEMNESIATHGIGAYTMPTYNAEPRYHKPPLIYWLQHAALRVTGTDFTVGGWGLLGARLPSALSALLAIGLLGFGVWHLTANRRWALYASLIFGLNLSFFVVARAATADGILNLTSLALVLWVLVLVFPKPLHDETPLHLQLRQRGKTLQMQRWGWVVTGVLGTLAFLAKGPIGWVPAGVVALVLLWARPNRMALWRIFAPLKTLLVIAALLTPWVFLLWQQHGADFFYEFFVVHNLQRFGGDLGNSQSSFMGYYLIVLLIGFFPWVMVLPASVITLLRKPHDRNKGRFWRLSELKCRLAAPDATTALPLLALVWAAVYIGAFSFSGTKLAHYIVPAYPALAIIIAGWLATPHTKPLFAPFSVLWGAWGLLLAGVLFIATPLLMAARAPILQGGWLMLQELLGFEWPLPDAFAMEILGQPIALGQGFTMAALLLVAVTFLCVAVRHGKPQLIPAVAALQAGFLATLALGVVPIVWAYTQGPLANIATLLAKLPTQTTVVHHGLHKPSLLLLGRHPFTHTDHPLQVMDILKHTPELWLVAERPDLRPLLLEMKNSGSGTVLDAKCIAGTCLLVLIPVTSTPNATPQIDTTK